MTRPYWSSNTAILTALGGIHFSLSRLRLVSHVFLMSDNRNRCIDSRHFGPVAITSVDGRLRHRYFPRSRAGAINQPES